MRDLDSTDLAGAAYLAREADAYDDFDTYDADALAEAADAFRKGERGEDCACGWFGEDVHGNVDCEHDATCPRHGCEA